MSIFFYHYHLIFYYFLDGKFDKALELYTEAIDLNPNVAAYYGNRSFCNIKMDFFGAALEDANSAIKIDKKYIKVSTIFHYFVHDFH